MVHIRMWSNHGSDVNCLFFSLSLLFLISKNSPGSMASIANPPGTPRDDSSSEMGSSFINPFQSESVRACVERRPRRGRGSRGARGGRGTLWQGRTGLSVPTANSAISCWKQQLSEVWRGGRCPPSMMDPSSNAVVSPICLPSIRPAWLWACDPAWMPSPRGARLMPPPGVLIPLYLITASLDC